MIESIPRHQLVRNPCCLQALSHSPRLLYGHVAIELTVKEEYGHLDLVGVLDRGTGPQTNFGTDP